MSRRSGRAWRGTGASLAALAVFACGPRPAFSQDEPMPVEELKLPLERYEDGSVKVQLFAKSAQVAKDGNVEATGVQVEFLDPKGNVEGVAKAERCRYSRTDQVVVSDSDVVMDRGPVTLSGRGFAWSARDQLFKILDRTRVVVRGSVKAKEIVTHAQ